MAPQARHRGEFGLAADGLDLDRTEPLLVRSTTLVAIEKATISGDRSVLLITSGLALVSVGVGVVSVAGASTGRERGRGERGRGEHRSRA